MAQRRNPIGKSWFGRRLAISFALIAMLTAVLAGVILSLVWLEQFNNYVRETRAATAAQAAQNLASRYGTYGTWSQPVFEELPAYSIANGYGIQVSNASGGWIYDDRALAVHFYEQVTGLTNVPLSDAPVAIAPIRVGDTTLGYVRLWTIGSRTGASLSDKDLRFRRGALYGLGIAGLIAALIASFVGLMYARRMVRPVELITETAEALRAGDSKARTGMSGPDEIGLLGRTFDEMADSIEADRELERRLTADVAHELRTPLQAIQATVEAMQDGVLPMDEERLSIVRDETVRLARLADGILELTRLERGATPMRISRVDLAGPARAAVDSHRALFEACNLVLALDVTEGVWISGDPDRLQQAVGNLLSNAARYTPEGGRVAVAVRREDDQAVVEVSDTGVGIAEEDLPRVFQRFWRAGSARDRASGGLGIGLAVVKEIVERHGGTVGVSRRPGGGTTFALRFPLYAAMLPGGSSRA